MFSAVSVPGSATDKTHFSHEHFNFILLEGIFFDNVGLSVLILVDAHLRNTAAVSILNATRVD